MQCGCPHCGTLTVHELHGMESRCVCPNCGWICRDCLGDGGGFAPLTREQVQAMKEAKKAADNE